MYVDWIQLARDGNEWRAVTKGGSPDGWPLCGRLNNIKVNIDRTDVNWIQLARDGNDELSRTWKRNFGCRKMQRTASSAQQLSGYRQEALPAANLTGSYRGQTPCTILNVYPEAIGETQESVCMQQWTPQFKQLTFREQGTVVASLWHSMRLVLGRQDSHTAPPTPGTD